MEEALVNKLLASSSLDVLIGDRIRWGKRDQSDPLPTVVLTKVSSRADYHMTARSGLTESRVQVDCWAATFSQSVTIARAIKEILSGAQFSQDGIEFQGIFLDAERQLYEEDLPERFHRVSMDFIIWHSE
jgi:hypothetical protein